MLVRTCVCLPVCQFANGVSKDTWENQKVLTGKWSKKIQGAHAEPEYQSDGYTLRAFLFLLSSFAIALSLSLCLSNCTSFSFLLSSPNGFAALHFFCSIRTTKSAREKGLMDGWDGWDGCDGWVGWMPIFNSNLRAISRFLRSRLFVCMCIVFCNGCLAMRSLC